MSKQMQVHVSAVLLSLVILTWFGVGLLVFYVPKLAQAWADADYSVSLAQRTIVNMGAWLGGYYSDGQVIPGVVIIYMPLIVLTIGSAAWRIRASKSLLRTT